MRTFAARAGNELCCGAGAPPYLHVGVVRRGEGLVYGGRASPFAAIGVVPFGVDHPLAPADLLKVHPHVHLPAERIIFLLLLLRVLASRSSSGYVASLLRALVPLDPVAPHLECCLRAWRTLPVHADVLGLLSCVDESGGSLVGAVLSGEHHHHDPVSRRVAHELLSPAHLLLRALSWRIALQPATQRLRHVENLPGGRRIRGARLSSQAAQEHLVLCVLTLVPVRVVDVHLGRFCESGQTDAQLSQVNVVACRDGGHVKGDGPPPAELHAAWMR